MADAHGREVAWVLPISSILLGINFAWVYSTRVVLPNAEIRIALQERILEGVADSPWQFRFAAPYLGSLWDKEFIVWGLSNVQAHQLSHLILDTLGASSVFLLASLLAGFSRTSTTILLQLLIYAGLNIAFYDHAYAPWSLPEIAFWLLSVFLVNTNRAWGLLFTLPLLALFRETGLLLGLSVVILLAIGRSGRISFLRSTLPAVIGLLLGLGVQLLIRVVTGPRPDDITFLEILAINFSPTGIRQTFFNLVLFIGLPMVILIVARSSIIRTGDWEIRILVSMIPYFMAVIVGSIWFEVRVLVVALPIVSIIALRAWEYKENLRQAG